jgi:predicted transcriptional regulator
MKPMAVGKAAVGPDQCFGDNITATKHAMEFDVGTPSAARFSITMSERLNRELEEVAGQDDASKATALRKAVQLYIVSRKAVREGMKVGIAKPNQELTTEFINL